MAGGAGRSGAWRDGPDQPGFGPAGAVEGDADVGHATSLLDYVFRNLAMNYLGGCDVPEGVPQMPPEPLPLLPLELPTQMRAKRPGLRLVANG